MSTLRWRENWPWLVAAAGFFILLWLLSPILTPFVLGAGLAYVGDPIVDRLERWRLSRTAGVCLVFVAIFGASLLAIVLLLPMLQSQLTILLGNIPDWLVWIQDHGLARVGITLPEGVRLDAAGLKRIVTEHWSEAGGFIKAIWTQVSQSGGALVAAAANLLLVPVVTFYLLRDWDLLVAWIGTLVPPRHLPDVSRLAHETDDVLGAFIRGQLSVMAALSLYYWLALWIAGLNVALLIGLIVGLISFVPYLGAIVGIMVAAIAMIVQTQDPLSLLWIGAVFGIGQVLESNVLTPWLVGDRIGLHPVTVIFAVMAGGQLFGFVGVMLALPVGAVAAVMMREAKTRWLQSPLYRADAPPEASPGEPAPAADPPPQ
jgi:predicted PurR-regulated permease PerM